jgi:outer membrane protein OmpA-like peptidoglycan-associated protein
MMRTMRGNVAFALVMGGLILLGGCASGKKLTREQALGEHAALAGLTTALEEARGQGVPDLAPDGFMEASESADRAMDAAKRGRAADADTEAGLGQTRLNRARADAEVSRDVLRDVLGPRERARKAGAADLFAEEMNGLDERLRDVSRLVERQRVNEARDRRVPLINAYRKLELDALKKGTVTAAEAAIKRAEQAGAKERAPKTFRTALDELDVARSILEANREDKERAEGHARRALWLAARATQISEVVRDFDRLDYTGEDFVLWHQDQLATIAAPMKMELPLDTPNLQVVQGVADGVAGLVAQNADLEARLAVSRGDLETQLAAAKKQLAETEARYQASISTMSSERQEMEKREQETRAKFDGVQALFTPEEANVYRQRQNVLISAQGFWFPSGQSEIEAVNFPLLKKITTAIKAFPGARVGVMGHTDAAGDDTLNMTLSQARADKVAKFLVDVGGVDPQKIEAKGFGEERPVASNDTKEGRAANRRVEILILNE